MNSILGIAVKNPQQIFTHLENDTNKSRTFLVDTMMEFAIKHGADPIFSELLIPTTIPLELEVAQYLRTNQGIEEDRLRRLVNPYLQRPGIAISWGKDEAGADIITLVDGNHRYVKKAERGDQYINVFIFRQELWEQFILPEFMSDRLVREGFLHRVSNIIERERKWPEPVNIIMS